ncbi:MAG: hypothetical protein N3E40_03215 [Dehalococcoidia bacterium]|nr:hypothetical protein [Dehalococcoidia bacterium]
MLCYIVVTTINLPTSVQGYCENISKFHRKGDTGIIVIGDRKTPKETSEFLAKLSKDGFECLYYDISAQEQWLRKFPDLARIIPYDSDNRRNVGFLIAVERGAEIIISIDDDNYMTEADFVGEHSIVGKRHVLPSFSSSSGWFNVYSLMETCPARPIYPRGFPYCHRGEKTDIREGRSSGRVVMNAGLLLGDPDVDAVTRLNEPVQTTNLQSYDHFVLAPGTWCPINTQNTAFHRDVLPAYYYIPMGYSFKGLRLDRYGDIWSGYFARKIIDHMGDMVCYGKPLARHIRNTHNLFKDLGQEFWGMVLTDKLADVLKSVSITGNSYAEAYAALSRMMPEMAGQIRINLDGFDNASDIRTYFEQIRDNMLIWLDACSRLLR